MNFHRYIVQPSAVDAGMFTLLDVNNVCLRRYPNEWEARQVRDWLQERDAGYPASPRLTFAARDAS